MLALVGCGGGDDDCNPKRQLFAGVGGSIDGLLADEQLTLRLDHPDGPDEQDYDRNYDASTPFLFKGVGLPNCTEFEVTIAQQPESQQCELMNGVGRIVDGAYLEVEILCQ